MEFKDVVKELGVLKKLHTANQGKNKTIFIKGTDNPNGKLVITRFDGETETYDLHLINLLSLNNWDGLLIHYDSLEGRKLYPYKFKHIREIRVDFR